jgi:hypothetical protein
MSSSVFSYALYALFTAALLAWGVFTRLRHPRYATLDGIVGRMMRHPALRWGLWFGWAFVGWHFFVRGSGAFK